MKMRQRLAAVASAWAQSATADAVVLASLVFSGKLEFRYASVDSRTGGPLPVGDMFKVWVFLGLQLQAAAELDEDRRRLLKTVMAQVQRAFGKRADGFQVRTTQEGR